MQLLCKHFSWNGFRREKSGYGILYTMWFPLYAIRLWVNLFSFSHFWHSPSFLQCMHIVFQIRKFVYFLFCYLFHFWLRWVYIALRGLSLVSESGGRPWLRCAGLMRWLLLLQCVGSGKLGLQQLRHVGSVVAEHGLRCSEHMKSSWTRDWTCAPWIGRQTPVHYATRGVQKKNCF